MLEAIVTILLAGLATLSQPKTPDEYFLMGQDRWSIPVIREDFIGRNWVCDPAEEGLLEIQIEELKTLAVAVQEEGVMLEAEMCYAGIELPSGTPITGP